MQKVGSGLLVVAVLLSGCSGSSALKAHIKGIDKRVAQLEEASTQQQIEAMEVQEQLQTTRAQVTQATHLAEVARDLAAGSFRREEVRRVTVYFDHASSTITAKAQKMIDGVIEEMGKNPELAACVTGFTDASGDPKFNDWLATRRANKVRQALVSRSSVDVLRVACVGLGSSRPIADNETIEGRRQNRRVEISLVRPKASDNSQLSHKGE
jgi:outer membrane protein OmpA-like peptidoglycan-associated protein